MRSLLPLAACAALTDGLSAAPPPPGGDTEPCSTLTPWDAKRFAEGKPLTRSGVLRLIGPPVKESRYVEAPGIAVTRDAPWITRWEYYTANGSITVEFDNSRVIMFGFSERGK
jgi:hypothetical protein